MYGNGTVHHSFASFHKILWKDKNAYNTADITVRYLVLFHSILYNICINNSTYVFENIRCHQINAQRTQITFHRIVLNFITVKSVYSYILDVRHTCKGLQEK